MRTTIRTLCSSSNLNIKALRFIFLLFCPTLISHGPPNETPHYFGEKGRDRKGAENP